MKIKFRLTPLPKCQPQLISLRLLLEVINVRMKTLETIALPCLNGLTNQKKTHFSKSSVNLQMTISTWKDFNQTPLPIPFKIQYVQPWWGSLTFQSLRVSIMSSAIWQSFFVVYVLSLIF